MRSAISSSNCRPSSAGITGNSGVPERNSTGLRRGRIADINVWIAAALLRPRTATVSVIAAIAAALLINLLILVLMKPAETLFLDCTEAYAWGQQFLFGYGRHPPVTGWIAGVWYRAFPAQNWASYALSQVMTGISLVSIYFIGEHVLGRRRATLVVFAMLLYPLFIGAKSDHFNNAQVLLALLPLTVWMFLRAYERPTVGRGIMLGVAAAVAMLTYYSAAFGLFGTALAAILLPGRRRFFANLAPYAAVVVFVLAVIPHLVWLVHHDFSTLHWVDSLVENRGNSFSVVDYLGQQFGLLAFCLIGPAVALWPWRFRKLTAPPPTGERAIVTIVATILVFGPVLLALVRHVSLQLGWGNSLFFLVPIVVASFVPMILVTRRAVVVAVWIAAIFLFAQLLGAPVYAWARFMRMPGDGVYRPFSEAAIEITELWRERFHSPLPIVATGFEVASPVVFYSPDHPKMFGDFIPAYSPWIDFPDELIHKGYVGICLDDGSAYYAACLRYFANFSPAAEQIDISLQRHAYSTATPPLKLHLEIVGPKP
jgi:4-amino-4-deoxy-L-arabinose transferase-like glycosyltransferase